ncbi:MAG: hypothetical protein ABJI55_00600 [Ekhidna sp.]
MKFITSNYLYKHYKPVQIFISEHGMMFKWKIKGFDNYLVSD